jgi:asparagine synthetase B (glutamine-hydrolysing)
MCGSAGIILAQRDRRAPARMEGRVAATMRHRWPDSSGLVTGGGACPEILLAGAVDLLTTSATYQLKVMS